MAEKCRLGLIGYGLVAPFHAKALEDSQEAELVAVAGRNADKARAFCTEHGGEPLDGIEAIFARNDIDVLNILTPAQQPITQPGNSRSMLGDKLLEARRQRQRRRCSRRFALKAGGLSLCSRDRHRPVPHNCTD